MNIITVLFVSISLAADAFAVAVCKGLSFKNFCVSRGIIVGLYFGFFQALMPLLGYLLGSLFNELILSIDHWIAFVLLVTIGVNMLRGTIFDEDEVYIDDIGVKEMLPLAIATSIDALAIGITLSVLKTNVIIAVCSIGIITFLLSFLGVFLGYRFGVKYRKKAVFIGGIILIFMGIKVLLEHIG